MTRAEEAVLAFAATAEVEGKPWLVSMFIDDQKMQNLIAEGMIDVSGETLIASVKGWRFLDSRPPVT